MSIHIDSVRYNHVSMQALDRHMVTTQGLTHAGVPETLLRQFTAATDKIIKSQSAWNPHAADPTCPGEDFCPFDGAPARAQRGLMQLSPTEFAKFHVDGTSTNIYDPAASIAAGWRSLAHWHHINLHTGDGLAEFMANRPDLPAGVPK